MNHKFSIIVFFTAINEVVYTLNSTRSFLKRERGTFADEIELMTHICAQLMKVGGHIQQAILETVPLNVEQHAYFIGLLTQAALEDYARKIVKLWPLPRGLHSPEEVEAHRLASFAKAEQTFARERAWLNSRLVKPAE